MDSVSTLILSFTVLLDFLTIAMAWALNRYIVEGLLATLVLGICISYFNAAESIRRKILASPLLRTVYAKLSKNKTGE